MNIFKRIKQIIASIRQTFNINLLGQSGVIQHGFSVAGVSEKDMDECFDWCFGHESRTMPCNCLDEQWNKLHGDIFLMYGTDIMWKSCCSAGEQYIKSKG